MNVASFIPSERTLKKVSFAGILMINGIPHSFFGKFIVFGFLETRLNEYRNGPFFVVSRPNSKNLEALARTVFAAVVLTGISYVFPQKRVRLLHLYKHIFFVGSTELFSVALEFFSDSTSAREESLQRKHSISDIDIFLMMIKIYLDSLLLYAPPSKTFKLNILFGNVPAYLVCQALVISGVAEGVSIQLQKRILFATKWRDSKNTQTLIRAAVSIQLFALSGFFTHIRPCLSQLILSSITANFMTLDLFSYTQKIDIIVSARLENQNRLKQLFFDSVDNQRDENMKDLIRYGVDLNETNKNGETALCLAACSEKVKLIKCLVELGDNINATNKNGLKVLWAYLIKIRSYILFRKPWAIEPLRCLIAYGADVHVTHLNEDVPGNGVALFDYVAINRMGFDIAMDPEYLAPISEIIKEILPAIFLEDSSEHNPYYQRALQKQEEEPLPNLDLLTLWKSYQSELEALEKWMVCSTRVKDISLAKVVRASNHDKLVELAWAKGLMKEVLDPKFQEAFPVFGWMVRAKLEAAFAQTESITKAEAPLFRLIQKNRPTKALPLEMCREILSYLPISDLENVKHV